jgi:hypothetical protein
MWIVSATSNRWGARAGGILAGLPLTSAPISIFLAVEQGTQFAKTAAAAGVSGLAAVTISYTAYIIAAPTNPANAAIACVSSYIVAALALRSVHLDVLSLVAINVALGLFLLALTNGKKTALVTQRRSWWDIPSRMASATGLVIVVTGLAPFVGPKLSGILSPLPVVAWPLIVFVHVRQGYDGAIASIRGTVQGAFGVLGFYLCVAELLKTVPTIEAYIIAVITAIGLTAPWLLFSPSARASRARF